MMSIGGGMGNGCHPPVFVRVGRREFRHFVSWILIQAWRWWVPVGGTVRRGGHLITNGRIGGRTTTVARHFFAGIVYFCIGSSSRTISIVVSEGRCTPGCFGYLESDAKKN